MLDPTSLYFQLQLLSQLVPLADLGHSSPAWLRTVTFNRHFHAIIYDCPNIGTVSWMRR
jgi:hypothetical protein